MRHLFSTTLELIKMKLNSSNNTTCQRCKQSFVCNAVDIKNCDCTKIQLTAEETIYISNLFSNCICNACLLHLKNEFLKQK